jgi:hypothetical protein
METWKINGLKNHDYHIFMERLMPTMFHGYLNDDVWVALAELSLFYIQLCAKEIKKEMMEKLEKGISMLLCKLEKIVGAHKTPISCGNMSSKYIK